MLGTYCKLTRAATCTQYIDRIQREFFELAMTDIGGPALYLDAFSATKPFPLIDDFHFGPEGYNEANLKMLGLLL